VLNKINWAVCCAHSCRDELNILNCTVCCAQSYRFVVLNNINWAVFCAHSFRYVVLNIINWTDVVHIAVGSFVLYYKLGCLFLTEL
jgi:hypothetical protein